MSLNIADRRLRYRIGEKHMCVKDGTRGLPIADCDIASAEGIRAYVYKKEWGRLRYRRELYRIGERVYVI